MLRKLKLGTKFTLLLTLVFLGGICLSGIILASAMQRFAEEDVSTKAEMLAQTMNSVREYTDNSINPLLENQLLTAPVFIPETVPGYAARQVFEQFRTHSEYKSFLYKEATLNPTNPRDQADEFEINLVEQFRQQPQKTKLSGYRPIYGETLFYIARPLKVTQKNCLVCHGQPASAPKSMIQTYGTQGGFGWKLNEIVAAQTVYVPADEVFTRVRHTLTLVMSIVVTVFALGVWFINRFLKGTVIQPLKQLTAIAQQVGAGTITVEQVKGFDSPEIIKVAQRADEPGQLARTFQYMAHEVATREQNLTQVVNLRTAELAASIQEAETARAKAEAANKTKSLFLSNMSHELRTPLNVISGFVQLMLRNGSLNSQQQNYLETIRRSGEHLLTLINDVLEMSKIEAGRTTLNETNFNLAALLNWLQQVFQFKAQSKNIELIFAFAANLPKYIYTDESKLRQILVNLLGNAIKFTPKGQVTLRVSVVNQQPLTLKFEVEDTGLGISQAELANLFEPFVQTESGRKSQEGTGLGLAISRSFVQLMGGDITVISQEGFGSTFQFTIQTQAVVTAQIEIPAPSQQVIGLIAGQPKYKILVAEDKPENRQLLIELLTPVGFEVRCATNGQEAINLWQSWQPHLIWMDMKMPVLNGYEATKQIKAAGTPPTIVIALSGSAFEEDRQIALSSGCDDFVRKPFRTEEVFDKMALHLGVRYLYAVESSSSTNNNYTLTPQDLAVMPAAWIAQLQDCATKVNAKQILQLINQIPPSHAHLANGLTQLVNNFDFENILVLTK
ncbi:MAG TPA: DUF3365 domain-containing protein [Trichormus sp. M33_DOE_039]|nr:DUF3365 domain-containing protein [Trichormus sp. M33_DOE_039]